MRRILKKTIGYFLVFCLLWSYTLFPLENVYAKESASDIEGDDLYSEMQKARIKTLENIPADAFYYGGSYYAIYHADSINEAINYCDEVGGHLATLTTKEENENVYKYASNNGGEYAFFGFSDEKEEGKWKWVTGEEVTYTNWYKGEPNSENSNEDYALFYFGDSSWNDGRMGKGSAYICEWEENDPNATNPPVSEEPGIDDPDPVTPTDFPTEAPGTDDSDPVMPTDFPTEAPGIDNPDPVTPTDFPTEAPGIDDPDPVTPTDFPTEAPGTDDPDPVAPTDFPEQKQPQDFTTRYDLSLKRQVGTILTQTVIGNETDVRYSSSNTRVATVSNMGRITCKAVGTALITVTAIESDEYEKATKTLTLTVMPKKVSVRSMKSKKKGQIIVTSGTTMAGNDGYQIQYKNKGRTRRVDVKTSKTSVTRTFTGLKSGTKVQVRIRAYKRVGGRMIFGPYSNWKSNKVF